MRDIQHGMKTITWNTSLVLQFSKHRKEESKKGLEKAHGVMLLQSLRLFHLLHLKDKRLHSTLTWIEQTCHHRSPKEIFNP